VASGFLRREAIQEFYEPVNLLPCRGGAESDTA
jgi:hypothetical protein